jgi:hypothetical protein
MINNRANSCSLLKVIGLFSLSLTLSAMDQPEWGASDLVELNALREALAQAPREVLFFNLPPKALYRKLIFLAQESNLLSQQIAEALEVLKYGFYPNDLLDNRDLLSLLTLADTVGMTYLTQGAIERKSLENYSTVNPFEFSSETLAKAITLVQVSWFKKISIASLRDRKAVDCPIRNWVNNDSKLGSLFSLKLLLESNNKTRLKNFTKLYRTGLKLEEMGNIAGSLVIFSALTRSTVSRLVEDVEQTYPKLKQYENYNSEQYNLINEAIQKPSYLLPSVVLSKHLEMTDNTPKDNQENMMRKFALSHHTNLSHANYKFNLQEHEQVLITLFSNILHQAHEDVFSALSAIIKPYSYKKEEKAAENCETWGSLELVNFFLDRNLREPLEKLICCGISNGEALKNIFENCSRDEEKARIISCRYALPQELSLSLVKNTKFVKCATPSLKRTNSSMRLTPNVRKRGSNKRNGDKIQTTPAANDTSPIKKHENRLELIIKNDEITEFPISPRLMTPKQAEPVLNFKKSNRLSNSDEEKAKKFIELDSSEVNNIIFAAHLSDPFFVESIFVKKSGKHIFEEAVRAMNKEIERLNLQITHCEILMDNDTAQKNRNKIKNLRSFFGVNEKNMYFLYFTSIKIKESDAEKLASIISIGYRCKPADFNLND